MSNALAGHNALLAIEKDGDPGGTFTAIAELKGDLSFPTMRDFEEVTPHNDTVDGYTYSPVIKRGEIPLAGNFLYDNAVQDHLTGLQKRHFDGDTFGIRYRGPSGAADTDEIICSGQLVNFERIAPEGAGPYRFTASFRPTGPFIIDSVTFGTEG
jgi:hypothetical protein